MKKILITVVAAVLSLPLAAVDRTTYRDGSGRTAGSATTNGNRTTYRDASGRITGTSTDNGNGRTTYRDASGRNRGTSTK